MVLMERVLPHKSKEKPEVSNDDRTEKSSVSPIYLIGFFVIMLFALALHFIPQKQETDQSIVEPYVEAVPSQSL